MAYFLHMSEKEQIKFVEPIDIYYDSHSYNPVECLYLSQVILSDDSELSSAWREHSKQFADKDKILGDEESTISKWVNGFNHFYKVDMNKDKILIISNRNDLRQLFENYGVYHDYKSRWMIYECDKIAIYQNFLKHLKKDKLDIVENHPEEILKLVSPNKTHHIIIKDGLIVPPAKKGVTIEFVASVCYELKKVYDKLMEKQKLDHYERQYDTINWNKMRDDGYSGVYYTKNIIMAAMSDKYLYDKDWKDFMKYLRTDTLIVWKDDVLTSATKENVLRSFDLQ